MISSEPSQIDDLPWRSRRAPAPTVRGARVEAPATAIASYVLGRARASRPPLSRAPSRWGGRGHPLTSSLARSLALGRARASRRSYRPARAGSEGALEPVARLAMHQAANPITVRTAWYEMSMRSESATKPGLVVRCQRGLQAKMWSTMLANTETPIRPVTAWPRQTRRATMPTDANANAGKARINTVSRSTPGIWTSSSANSGSHATTTAARLARKQASRDLDTLPICETND